MRNLSLGVLVLAALVGPARANVPAAFFACEGAAEGEACQTPGPNHGACVRDTRCTDQTPDNGADDCLLCVDPCWASEAEGGDCVQITGAAGICRQQGRCTDVERTSFFECNRCVSAPACEAEGARCERDGVSGRCARDGACSDPTPEDGVDNCLRCADACAEGDCAEADAGASPGRGEAGCGVETRGLADGGAALAWVLILGAAGREARRRRT